MDEIFVYILLLLVGDDLLVEDEIILLLMFVFFVNMVLVDISDLGVIMFLGYLELLLLFEGYSMLFIVIVLFEFVNSILVEEGR